MTDSATPDADQDGARPGGDPSPRNSAADAGSESPEEGAAAAEAADDAVIEPDEAK